MHVLLIRLSLLAVMALSGCWRVSVKYDYDREVEFRQYKTYDWIEKKSPINSRMEQYIKAGIDTVMTAKGYERVLAHRPDLLINFYADVQDKIDVSSYGYGYWRRPDGARHVDVHHYQEGTLVIDIVDPQMKQLIWRGWGSARTTNSGKTAAEINETVAKILEKFPPPE